jgi:uncharacterized protein YkwD
MKRYLPTLLVSSIILAACGGGGSGTSSPTVGATTPTTSAPAATPSPAPAPVPTVTPADLQTSSGTSTYAASSQELAFFTMLNDFRGKLGLGLVMQSAAMDKADSNHLQYLLTNNVDFGAVDPVTGRPVVHSEDPARPGYTGVGSLDRAKFAGYPAAYMSEQLTYGLGSGATVALSSLIASVYHREGLMSQAPRDFGISVGTDKFQTMVLSFGYTTKAQKNASDFFGVYPADKQTGVALATYPEVPNPYPEITMNEFATKSSFPVTVVSEESTTLAVESFTMTEAGQGTPLDARLLTAASDPNKLLKKNTAYLVGKAAFKAGTTYNVSFKGTVNGAAVTKAWSFTTK